MIIGSSKAIDCSFKQNTGKVEHYSGTIGKFGLDVGVTGKSYFSWIVVNTAPTRVGDGALAARMSAHRPAPPLVSASAQMPW